ncbi:hypothetical protein [Flavimarina sp. Hel_I_48]|uniref:hypothetical protein n=1 Tax=Flavimarina sp. Hel_I_48 TaxID=1392488 RepID=UPI0004DF2141|nr:hypothetical protein [Flavimarina sp. Hel_I_48]
METKIVNKNCFLFLIFIMVLLGSKLVAQSNGNIYFLINPTDSLIQKQLATGKNSYNGYLIVDENRIKELHKTPVKKGKIWVPENEDDFHANGPSFTYDEKNDTLIDKNCLKTLNIIKDRRKFLTIDNGLYDLSGNNYYFIERLPNQKGKYLM